MVRRDWILLCVCKFYEFSLGKKSQFAYLLRGLFRWWLDVFSLCWSLKLTAEGNREYLMEPLLLGAFLRFREYQ